MQSILTRYHPATNTKPSRVSATASGCKVRVMLSWDSGLSTEGNHSRAALALMSKLDWTGEYIGGDLERGMVFVSTLPTNAFVISR